MKVSALAPHAPERRRIAGLGTDEQTWRTSAVFDGMRSLDVRDWRDAYRRVWVLAPHPDDEVLALGGSLAALSEVHVDVRIVSVTDGEASHVDSIAWPRSRLVDERALELQHALDVLRVDAQVIRLRLPDGRVGAHREALLKSLVELVGDDDLLLASCRFDGHPDHEACGDVAQLAAELTGATVHEYPVWMWHWASPDESVVPWARACRLAVPADTIERKRDAINAFVSQTTPDAAGAPVLPDHVLPRFLRPFEVLFA